MKKASPYEIEKAQVIAEILTIWLPDAMKRAKKQNKKDDMWNKLYGYCVRA